MYEFDHCRQLVMVIPLITESPGRQYDQRGPQALAAAAYNVLGHGPHKGNIGIKPSPDHFINGPQVGGKKIAQNRDRHRI